MIVIVARVFMAALIGLREVMVQRLRQ